MKRAVALSTAPSGSVKRGKGAALRDHFHHALPGPCGEFGAQRNLAALLRSQLAWFSRRECGRGSLGLGMTMLPSATVAATASRGPRRLCQFAEAM